MGEAVDGLQLTTAFILLPDQFVSWVGWPYRKSAGLSVFRTVCYSLQLLSLPYSIVSIL